MWAPASRRLDSRLAPVAQLAEATDLKSVCCGFESHRGYCPRGTFEAVAGARLSVPGWILSFVARIMVRFPLWGCLVRH